MTSENVTDPKSVESAEAVSAKAVDDQLIDELVGGAQAVASCTPDPAPCRGRDRRCRAAGLPGLRGGVGGRSGSPQQGGVLLGEVPRSYERRKAFAEARN
ncbi:hypothetical protein ACGFNY_44440 [Streptomyces chartreusis]|uniref:hypothetical protein n=1 Tax=Streptomyces chartreusis TaxID=1969 RepID=UPI003710A6BE